MSRKEVWIQSQHPGFSGADCAALLKISIQAQQPAGIQPGALDLTLYLLICFLKPGLVITYDIMYKCGFCMFYNKSAPADVFAAGDSVCCFTHVPPDN